MSNYKFVLNDEFKNFKDFSKHRTYINTEDKLAQAKPTDEEIAAALKVLNDAGISPNTQNVMQTSSAVNPDRAALFRHLNRG